MYPPQPTTSLIDVTVVCRCGNWTVNFHTDGPVKLKAKCPRCHSTIAMPVDAGVL